MACTCAKDANGKCGCGDKCTCPKETVTNASCNCKENCTCNPCKCGTSSN
ncbi:hypothetical protein FA10DRAFT_282470 [Acaromyces ingoldii]|uniref:Uncharacterized protein n=1 Tax=Acaromyces ingoldii TaxID=215250 RepID=A0A316YTP5_9BASI|nr:hypothetical protein FA10DRAFT_282470 [Acaromyces ingoldii]PWN92787.1 hypothetical protein FA10DRAFT_282470 [Acaromyces ingoldii]